MLEVSFVTVFTIVAAALVGVLLLPDMPVPVLGIIAVVIIFGYAIARVSIGHSVIHETYTSPVALPDDEWAELVIHLPDEAVVEWVEADEDIARYRDEGISSLLPDLVSSSSVNDTEPDQETIRIDRAAIDAVVAEATATTDLVEEYGTGLLFPWNWSTAARRESEIESARIQLDVLADLLDTLPARNVTYT